jgi:molybdenum cofactor biosynthesis enzyme MoaA
LGYFDYLWRKSIRTLPSSIPAKYSFLEDKKFFVAPSLVVNVTSQCNMKCKYCPEGGENLNIVREEDLCSEATLKRVVEKFAKIMHDIKKSPAIIRITGGEPFVNSSCIHKTNGILTSAQHYDKIVLCTNGVELKKAYECNRPIWNAVKKQLLLKISLDTLDKKIYEEITGKDYLDTVKEAIKFANDMGYRIELNVVASKINIRSCEDIIKIFDYARSLGLVGIKILTVNNFGGNVDFEQSVEEKQYINKILEDLILLLRKMDLEERNVYLNDNKGIMMKRFVAVSSKTGKECTLTIVDHNSDNSITPQRTFGDICKECKYYCENSNNRNKITCATGLMSLTLRADGLLSPCRLKMEQGVDVKDLKTGKQIENAMKRQIAFFENGYHKGS